MAVSTELPGPGAFILMEGDGHYSRENGTLGEALEPGTICEANTAGELIAFNGSGTVVGINIYGGEIGDEVSYLARHAEVNKKVLNYPTESTAGGEEAASDAGLLAIGIIVRD